jgi:hypothetical protein
VRFLIEIKTKPLSFDDPEVEKFNLDVYYDPYPREIDIWNQYDCNPKSLKICLIDDPTTLLGCKELVVRCVHFDKDTEYHNGTVEIIP